MSIEEIKLMQTIEETLNKLKSARTITGFEIRTYSEILNRVMEYENGMHSWQDTLDFLAITIWKDNKKHELRVNINVINLKLYEKSIHLIINHL